MARGPRRPTRLALSSDVCSWEVRTNNMPTWYDYVQIFKQCMYTHLYSHIRLHLVADAGKEERPL